MAERIILDTSALIEIFDKDRHRDLLDNDCQISIVSVYEYIRYKKEKEGAKLFLEGAFETFGLSNPIILIAARIFIALKENGITVKENDVYIAATALANGVDLYTKDKDFLAIKRHFKDLRVKMLN